MRCLSLSKRLASFSDCRLLWSMTFLTAFCHSSCLFLDPVEGLKHTAMSLPGLAILHSPFSSVLPSLLMAHDSSGDTCRQGSENAHSKRFSANLNDTGTAWTYGAVSAQGQVWGLIQSGQSAGYVRKDLWQQKLLINYLTQLQEAGAQQIHQSKWIKAIEWCFTCGEQYWC